LPSTSRVKDSKTGEAVEKAEFRELLENHLAPMLSGSRIQNAPQSQTSWSIAAFENPVSIFVKPDKTTVWRLRLRRSQAWDRSEKRLVEIFIRQLANLSDAANAEYLDDLLNVVPRRVIAEFLGVKAKTVLLESMQQFESLASRTYEGHQITSAVGITGSVGYQTVRLDELWKEDFSMVLANGIDTIYVAGTDGRVFNLAVLAPGKNTPYAPHRFIAMANWCDTTNRVALALNRNGEILLFKDRKLQFAKRRGSWQLYSHEPALSRFGRGLRRRLKEAIYETCLDVSFARTGGCIAVVRRDCAARVSEYVNRRDVVDEAQSTKSTLLAKAIRGRPFPAIDRRLRTDLVSMDGATIIDHQGKVLAAGAIVKVPSGSSGGGGRRAAARQLSKLGLGIKISSDGPVVGFRRKQIVFTL
jgi:hypothetical protein